MPTTGISADRSATATPDDDARDFWPRLGCLLLLRARAPGDPIDPARDAGAEQPRAAARQGGDRPGASADEAEGDRPLVHRQDRPDRAQAAGVVGDAPG